MTALSVGLFTAKGGKLDVVAADAPISWDIESAPSFSLTIPDPDRVLTPGPGTLGDAGSDLYARVWARPWRVTETSRDEDSLGLTLEHRGIAGLRSFTGKFSASADVSRPVFAQQLWKRSRAGREADVLYCPIVVPEASGYKNPPLKDQATQKIRDVQLAPGFKAGAVFDIKPGSKASDAQKRVLSVALSIADELKAPTAAKLALLCALIVESEATNLSGGDGTSRGTLQVLASTASAIGLDPMNEEAVVREFLNNGYYKYRPVGAIELARKYPAWTPGQIAQACQGSAPNVYQQFLPEAKKILAAWTGSSSDDLSSASEGPEALSVGDGEDGWTAFSRIATDSQRRAYCTLDALYFVTDNQVARSRPLFQFARRDPGVKSLTWKEDSNRLVDTISMELVCTDLQAWSLAGHTVTIAGEGDADGVWLVSKWGRGSRSYRYASFELTKLRPFLPESQIAAASANTTGATTATSASTSASGGRVAGAISGSPIPGQPPHASTHQTDGLPGYPAYDYMAPAGTKVVAPVDGSVFKLSGRDPKLGGPAGGPLGFSIYIQGGNGKRYFLTHLDKVLVKVGQKVTQGVQIAQVAAGPPSWSTPHCHMGVNG